MNPNALKHLKRAKAAMEEQKKLKQKNLLLIINA